MSRLDRRVQSIESKGTARPPIFTREEMHLGRLVLARAISRRSELGAISEEALQLAEALGNQVKQAAMRQRDPSFIQHVADYVRPLWDHRFGTSDFLLPIVGSEYVDWDVPDLFQRRLAIRHDPIIVELIGPPSPLLGRPKRNSICWASLFGVIMTPALDTQGPE